MSEPLFNEYGSLTQAGIGISMSLETTLKQIVHDLTINMRISPAEVSFLLHRKINMHITTESMKLMIQDNDEQTLEDNNV